MAMGTFTSYIAFLSFRTIPVTVDIINDSSSTVQKVSVWLDRKIHPVVSSSIKETMMYTNMDASQLAERKSMPSTSFPLNGKERQLYMLF